MIFWIIAFADLLGLWLLMSGVYTLLIISFGVFSAGFAIFILYRMNLIDGEKLQVPLKIFGTITYLVWLLKEIAKSTIKVVRIILSRGPPANQKLFSVPVEQSTDIGQVVFANSITLTPGTITVEIEPGYFLVHALDHAPQDYEDIGVMGRKVKHIEHPRAGDKS